MTKRVFIIHGWDFNPGMNWYGSVKENLEQHGFEVIVPSMPDSHHPSITEWVDYLQKIVGEVDSDTYFIAHSIGCRTVMKFLESEVADGDSCGGVIFVGGWFTLSPAATPDSEYKSIAKPWLDMNLNFSRIKNKAAKFVAFFSDNDPYVPMNNITLFQDNLDAEVILESGMGHFDEESGVQELDVVASKIIEISS
jgi:uncharacterized protein